jgi:hypothetical protein
MYGLNRVISVKSIKSVKSYLAMAMLLCFGHAASAEQAPAVLRDNVLSIPQAVVVDGDDVSHFRNIRLAQEGNGSFAITAAEDGSLASVESVEILREADRIDVLSKGYRSACVSIETEAVSYQDGAFVVAIPETEPTSDVCVAQAIEYYVITTLPTDGLSPGDYTVSVNGVKTDFTL